jgi:hypothetical protein
MASYFLVVKDTLNVVEPLGSVRIHVARCSSPTESSLYLRVVMQYIAPNC